MAPSKTKDLQLTSLSAAGSSDDDACDMEDVRLLDSYDNRNYNGADEVEEGGKRIQVRVTGMTCAACSNSVEAALKAVDGVISASVGLLQNKAEVVYNPAIVKVGLGFAQGFIYACKPNCASVSHRFLIDSIMLFEKLCCLEC